MLYLDTPIPGDASDISHTAPSYSIIQWNFVWMQSILYNLVSILGEMLVKKNQGKEPREQKDLHKKKKVKLCLKIMQMEVVLFQLYTENDAWDNPLWTRGLEAQNPLSFFC